MSYNAAERKDVREAAKAARLHDSNRLEIVRGIMSLPAGRHYIYSLLASCHVFASTFSGNALQSAFSEGERNVGLRLLADIMSACPERYLLMIQERNARDLAQRPADPAESDGGDSGSVEDAPGYVEPGD